MDHNTIVAIITGAISGGITDFVISRRRRYKYKWKCPVCKDFSVDASSQEIVDRVKAVHTHEEN